MSEGKKGQNNKLGAKSAVKSAEKRGPEISTLTGLEKFDAPPDRPDISAFHRRREAIRDYIGAEFGHHAYILEHDEEFDFETLKPEQPSAASMAAAADPHGLVARDFQDKNGIHNKRLAKYKDGNAQVHTILYSHCTEAMKASLPRTAEFLAGMRAHNVLMLWLAIRTVSLQGRIAENEVKRRQDAVSRFEKMYQWNNEATSNFHKRFRDEYKAFKDAGNSLVQSKIFGNPTAAQRTAYATEVNEAEQKELAMRFIRCLDKKRYGSMLDELQNQQTAGNDNYPTKLDDAFTMAINRVENGRSVAFVMYTNPTTTAATTDAPQVNGTAFVADGKDSKAKAAKGGKGGGEKKAAAAGEGKPGAEGGAAAKVFKCYYCQLEGHKKTDCPMLAKAKKEYLKEKGGTSLVTVGEKSEGFGFVTDGVCNAAIDAKVFDDFEMLCDNEASISIFREKRLLSNIRPADHSMTVSGIGGKITATFIGDVTIFGGRIIAYYHPDSLANILCFFDLAKEFDVSFNRMKNRFEVGVDEKVLFFEPKGKLYVCNASSAQMNSAALVVNTVEENMKRFTEREINRASLARRLQTVLGYPSDKALARMITSGAMQNAPISVNDLYNAIRIWGPNLGALKGKTTRSKPNIVMIEPLDGTIIIDKEIVLCMDIFFVEGISFLMTISRKLNLLTAHHITDRGAKSLAVAYDEVYGLYASKGFKIVNNLFDGESGLAAIVTYIQAKGTSVNPTAKNEHVPEIERAGRTLKERVRSFWNTLPFRLTATLVVYLVLFCVMAINLFPKASSVSNNLSPREMFLGVKLDYARDCKLAFGEYVEVHEDNAITNTMEPRTTGAICLGPMGNAQGDYRFMSLSTWRPLKRKKWTPMPMNKAIIDMINTKADSERKNLRANGTFRLGNWNIPDEVDEEVEEEALVLPDVPHVEIQRVETLDSRSVPELLDIVESQGSDIVDADASDAIGQSDDTAGEMHYEAAPDCEPVGWEYEESIAGVQEETTVLPEEPAAVQDLREVYQQNRYNLRPNRRTSSWAEVFAVVLTNYSVQRGIKELGIESMVSLMKEMGQMEDKRVFHPMRYEEITSKDKGKLIRSLMFLKRKRNGVLKSRLVADGRMQVRLSGTDVSSPTVSSEALFMSAAIDAYEKRVVATVDIEGAYLHCDMDELIIMEVDDVLTSILVTLHPEKYGGYVHTNGKLYVVLDKALYGTKQAALLFNNNISAALEKIGFKKNPHDRCVFNRRFGDKQCTIVIHVDDLKISCVDPRGVDFVVNELTKVYGKVNEHREKVFDYLGMIFDYSEEGIVKISMSDMVQEVVDEFELSSDSSVATPAASYLYRVTEDSLLLGDKEREKFHSVVAKLLYMAKRARPDILTAVCYLTTRVLKPNEEDRGKLLRVVKYLNGTKDLALRLSCGADGVMITSYIDASFAVHPDGKGQTGTMISLGQGAVYSKSAKQKLVAKSSTEAELIGMSDSMSQVIWMRNFLLAQGYSSMGPARIHQDNRSTIMLAEKGRSTSTRTRHVAIRYFFVKDRIESKEVELLDTDTEDMVADYFSKPLQGQLFIKFREVIMGHNKKLIGKCHEPDKTLLMSSQGCVEQGAAKLRVIDVNATKVKF